MKVLRILTAASVLATIVQAAPVEAAKFPMTIFVEKFGYAA